MCRDETVTIMSISLLVPKTRQKTTGEFTLYRKIAFGNGSRFEQIKRERIEIAKT